MRQLRPGELEPDDLPDRARGLDESLVAFGRARNARRI
jgi:hypothetical protein